MMGNGGGAATRRGRIAEPDDPLAYKDDDDTSWLIPYVDVISLLLAFLILTLAMSKVSPRKFEMLTSKLSKQAEHDEPHHPRPPIGRCWRIVWVCRERPATYVGALAASMTAC